jgi:hypothetical protein
MTMATEQVEASGTMLAGVQISGYYLYQDAD